MTWLCSSEYGHFTAKLFVHHSKFKAAPVRLQLTTEREESASQLAKELPFRHPRIGTWRQVPLISPKFRLIHSENDVGLGEKVAKGEVKNCNFDQNSLLSIQEKPCYIDLTTTTEHKTSQSSEEKTRESVQDLAVEWVPIFLWKTNVTKHRIVNKNQKWKIIMEDSFCGCFGPYG